MREAARLKGVSYHTVSRAVRRGALPHRRLGKMVFVGAEDLAAWRPMVQRAPKRYRRREPDPGAAPSLVDLAAGDRVELAARFAVLLEAVHAAALDRPLEEFLGLLCGRLAEALGLSRAAVWGLDEGRGVVRLLARAGEPMSDLPDEVPLAEITWYAPFLASGGATVRDPAGFGPVPAPVRGVTSLFAAPLRVGGRTLGTLAGDRGGAPFGLAADQLDFAQALANQAAVALEVARLRDALAASEARAH
jgi:hypothetical protein